MELESILRTVINSTPEDWHVITTWGAGSGPSYRYRIEAFRSPHGSDVEVSTHAMVAVLKTDASITIAWGLTANDDFIEKWANKFDDPKASSSYVDVFYCGSLVFRELYVSVDGGRAHLPLPEQLDDGSMEVSRDYAAFIRLVHGLELHGWDFDDYMRRAKVNLTENEWPIL